MVIKEVSLETVCGITSKLPDNQLPEVAFAGKSNVGKSSLINAMVNRKKLARTSGQPGKTQTINFYNVNHEMYIVDLPGYGYAKISKSVSAKWGPMIENYLHTSRQLRMVFLLIDIRHKPTDNDVQMYRWILSNGFSPVIVATKLDKIKKSQVSKQLKLVKETLHVIDGVPVVPFSAVTRQGRDQIWDLIETYALDREEEEEVQAKLRDKGPVKFVIDHIEWEKPDPELPDMVEIPFSEFFRKPESYYRTSKNDVVCMIIGHLGYTYNNRVIDCSISRVECVCASQKTE